MSLRRRFALLGLSVLAACNSASGSTVGGDDASIATHPDAMTGGFVDLGVAENDAGTTPVNLDATAGSNDATAPSNDAGPPIDAGAGPYDPLVLNASWVYRTTDNMT